VRAQGIGLIPPKKGLEALELLLTQGATQVGVVPIVWEQFRNAVAGRPFFSAFAGATSSASESRSEFLANLHSSSRTRQHALLSEHVRSHTMKVLGLDTSVQTDVEQNLLSEGMDSLASMELRNNLQASLGITLPSTLIYDYPTIGCITDFLLSKLTLGDAAPDRTDVTPASATNTPNLDSLSEDELGAMLDRELQDFDSLE
jgi:acyl carrier protein